MNLFEIILLSVGLASDAFAVSICKGLSIYKINFKHMVIIGLWFGIFQGIMPLLGYFLSYGFSEYIITFNHVIALILLVFIGLNMIKESFSKEEAYDDSFDVRSLFGLALATSIDAFTTGITFSLFKVNLPFTIFLIVIITFLMSFIGVKIGNFFGSKYKSKAELFGGIILILLGIKIFLT